MTQVWSRNRILGGAATAAVAVIGLLGATTPVIAAPVELPGVVSADPVGWTPDVEDGKVRQTASVGGTTIAVGDFTQVTEKPSGVTFDRRDIVAFGDTGAISTTFTPDFDGTELYDVIPAADGNSVYVAGAFTSVDGLSGTGRVVKLDVDTGAVDTAFVSPGLNSRATELALVGDRLIVGGAFTRVAGQPRTLLVALDPVTGADTGAVDLTFDGTQHGGTTTVTRMAVTPDGGTLVVVGNFATVNGQARPQIAKIDLRGTQAALDSWSTSRYGLTCSGRFHTYVTDVDFSPDGSFFVVVTTGGYAGGPWSGTLCDTIARWEADRGGPGQEPTWIDYTGGDTVTAVAVTGPVVYTGGHFRWVNNPFASDQAGPGAVRRHTMAALDARNGLPLPWDPGRPPGWGVWGFRIAPDGLWIGHDTDQVGGEQHKRLAFLPSSGGTGLPVELTGSIPGTVYRMGRAPTRYTGNRVLYRVNAGGPMVLSIDGGPDWQGDTSAAPARWHGPGSATSTWQQEFRRRRSIPRSTPQAVFSTERADPPSGSELEWDFPVPKGTRIRVRLYFASGCGCTDEPGERRFDVLLDGQSWLDDYDIVADVGQAQATVKSLTLVSDGNVDIDFRHVVENPMVNAIEILRTTARADPWPYQPGAVRWRFDGSEVTGVLRGQITSREVDWSDARGAFMVDRRLYTGWANGTLYRRVRVDGVFGRARAVELFGLQGFRSDIQSVRAMFYDRASGRLYFNLAGQAGLYYRYFTPESEVVGAIRHVGPGDRAGIAWGSVRGAFLANSRLYFTTANGRLRSVRWVDGAPTGVVATVSGPKRDGRDWRSRVLFLAAS